MSRLAFRTGLEAPRPRSALILVALATGSLAASGEIAPAVLGLQALALGFAAWRRSAPFDWQRRAGVLNLGLVLCATIALGEVSRGAPASVALAALAVLASGLQLLDARPRRSEFLLVALALFQVVLASSLTDSLLFAPFLIAFLPTCVWTLLVHTLRSEALEAGDPAAAAAVLTPGLLGTTVAASLVSLVVALALFFVLPRLHEGLLRSGAMPALSTAGFSERVSLGDLGRIRRDTTVMLRVRTIEGEAPPPAEAYYRGLAFDRFDGRSWSVSDPVRRIVDGEASRGLRLARTERPANLVQEILREPVVSGVLFEAGDPVALEGGTGRIERDANGGLYAPETAGDRVRYAIAVQDTLASEAALALDHAGVPSSEGRYLALPPLSAEVTALAARIVAPARNDLERARAIERWLRRNGRYTDQPPPDDRNDPRSPIERFLLGELEAHCEYFASAMVVMARSQGLPARLANGFAGGRRNAVGDFVELVGSDAHAWVEIHFDRHGWVRFDPTPPDLRLAASAPPTLLDRIEDLRSALELLWFQHVVEFDRSKQFDAAIRTWKKLRTWLPAETTGKAATSGPAALERLRQLPVVWLVPAAAGALLLLLLRRRSAPTRADLPRRYAAALRLLARHGLVRRPAITPRGFAIEVGRRIERPGAEAFARLTEAYLASRWGGATNPERPEDLRSLRDSLRT
jgi:transglutaminase-like putative cysteine protease